MSDLATLQQGPRGLLALLGSVLEIAGDVRSNRDLRRGDYPKELTFLVKPNGVYVLRAALAERGNACDSRFLVNRCQLRAPCAIQLRENELLKDTGERCFTNSDQRRRDQEPAAAVIVRGKVRSLEPCASEASDHIRVIGLPTPIVAFADN